jgi:hypothetical protein
VIIFLVSTPAFATSYTLNPVDTSSPTIGDAGDGISQLGDEQAWFAFDLSSIPDTKNIVSATFSAYMHNGDDSASRRSLWYDSDDNWIGTPSYSSSDPDNPDISSADNNVGTVSFSNEAFAYTWITIDITHNWTNDLADNYITLMLTGHPNGFYSYGAVGLVESPLYGIFSDPELTLISTPAPGAILLGCLGIGIVGWMRRRQTL